MAPVDTKFGASGGRLRVVLLNCQPENRKDLTEAQIEALRGHMPDILLLAPTRTRRAQRLFEALDLQVAAIASGDADGDGFVAAIGASRSFGCGPPMQLRVEDLPSDVPEADRLRIFVPHHVAVDLSLPGRAAVRVASLYATPGTHWDGRDKTKFPQHPKPRFHAAMAQWMATWEPPFIFGGDFNTPKHDRWDHSATEFFMPTTSAYGGEDQLLGPAPLHAARDTLRSFLASSVDPDNPPPAEPLATTHRTGPNTRRFDQIWATPDLAVLDVSTSDIDRTVSDHAIVSVDLEAGSAA